MLPDQPHLCSEISHGSFEIEVGWGGPNLILKLGKGRGLFGNFSPVCNLKMKLGVTNSVLKLVKDGETHFHSEIRDGRWGDPFSF